MSPSRAVTSKLLQLLRKHAQRMPKSKRTVAAAAATGPTRAHPTAAASGPTRAHPTAAASGPTRAHPTAAASGPTRAHPTAAASGPTRAHPTAAASGPTRAHPTAAASGPTRAHPTAAASGPTRAHPTAAASGPTRAHPTAAKVASDISETLPTAETPAPTRSIRATLKGVDEKKFSTNPDYRKSFILRAAATKEPDVLRQIVAVAEEYGVEGWEVVAASVKYLFTTSGLSVEPVEAFLKRVADLIDRLKARKKDFIAFSGLHIQPHMANADMFLLELYSDFLTDIKTS